MNESASDLPENAFRRADETPDELFYRQPRFVTHIDAGAIAAVTQLYREYLPPGSAILDLMSSWVSHLPPEVTYRRVVGLGLNAAELRKNDRLTSSVVQNLNTDPQLPFADDEFDGAGITVSVDYLTQPVAVLRELGRVLAPGAPVIISFSNRCFPTKAVAVWHGLSDQGRLELVAHYLKAAGNWDEPKLLDRSPKPSSKLSSKSSALFKSSFGMQGDPLYAVVARAR